MQSLDETLPSNVSALGTERSQRDEELMDSVETADARSSLDDAVAIDRFVLGAGAMERNEHEVSLEVVDIAS